MPETRVAHVRLKHHDENAPVEAAARTGAMLEEGDLDGCGACQDFCFSLGSGRTGRGWVRVRT